MRTIAVRGAAEHNLKGFDVDIPREALVVVTGVSGSGKSSLAFDTIGREAQRRYLETFSSYARQFLGRVRRPAVRSIAGLSPAIVLDQRTTLNNPRSTVGTLTGMYDDLRLLFARLGEAPAGVTLSRRLFSFNSPHGACPACEGLGVEDRLDPSLLIADPDRSIRDGALVITTPGGYVIYSQVTVDVLDTVCRAHGFTVDTPWRQLTDEQRRVVLYGSDALRIPYGKHPLSSRLRWSGITAKPREEGVYKGILPVMEQILARSRNRNILRFVRSLPCRACGGTRLRPEALAVTFHGRGIAEYTATEVDDLLEAFRRPVFAPREEPVGEPIRRSLVGRAEVLQQLGLGHVTLARASATLSGGEAQRVRLASQLGSGLRGILYVLDEPSVGLHPAEQRQLIAVLHALRDRGNTVLVVEHDPEAMRGADWLVDIGPAAGDDGGELLFSGKLEDLVGRDAPPAARGSQTRRLLAGETPLLAPARRRPGSGTLRLVDAARHNLQHIDVDFLRGALNVVTGLSGAGKSSLVEELAARARDGRVAVSSSSGTPRRISKVIAVDQSPIGRTPRSNPATYTGLSDVVRDLFAAEPAARARGFGKGRFSFNVAGGRCDACQGAGVQQVGMHFLGTVDVVCEACGGHRFNEDTLEITYRGHTIHDVLDLTIDRAGELLSDSRRAARTLSVLRELGLGYLRLGQPSTTLSGGEAQRVKLAAELARPAGSGEVLYLLDEPTTGLHASDVAVLVAALGRLVDRGHTVVVIEHDLGVVGAADRVIDIGPGSGRRGGQLVVAATPEAVAACEASLTGAALRGELSSGIAGGAATRSVESDEPIRFRGVSTHNLAIPDVSFPANRFTVVTGVSGSGKSSLAFDTLYAEARNRFTESFSAYARRFLDKPGDAEFESVSGLRPAVAVRQRRPSRNPRSTVGTMSDIGDYYRLLYSRLGDIFCPSCGEGVTGRTCARCGWRAPSRPLTATMFSPNVEQGACPGCRGLGLLRQCDPERLVTHPGRSLLDGAMDGHRTGRFYGEREGQHLAILRAVGRALSVDFSVPWSSLGDGGRHLAMHGAGDRVFDVEWHYRRGRRTGTHRFQSSWKGFVGYVGEEYERKHGDRRGEALEPLLHDVTCSACAGMRLKPQALAVRVAGLNIAELQRLTVAESLSFFGDLAVRIGPRAALIAADVSAEVTPRLERLRDAGLEYLALDRAASTLSAGEAQRVRLAAEVSSGLTGVTYVLDEPTAGLHARDTERLLRVVRGLQEAGNTLVVVEHDVDVILAADNVIDIGPGAGAEGGRVIASGPPSEIAAHASPTGDALRQASVGAARATPTDKRRTGRPGLSVAGISCHNLRDLSVEIPAGVLVAVTGVSGSGKSTLVFDVIEPAVAAACAAGDSRPASRDGVTVHEPFVRVVSSRGDGLAISPSGNPAAIVGASGAIRGLFAASEGARAAGFTRSSFSTAQKGGRCDLCEGEGTIRVSMDFLPDVRVVCEACGGRRFRAEVLACKVEGLSIADVLEMTAAHAASFFGRSPEIAGPLRILGEIGLGYIRLGQPVRTLSGGERQRLALAADLATPARTPSLYLFDEPTTGLHQADVARLTAVLHRLVSAGNTVVVVEHHLDVIRLADHVIDMGPEGGIGGGRVVVQGTPEEIQRSGSHTGMALARRTGRRQPLRPEATGP